MAFDNANAIESFLPASGSDGPLDANLFDPPTSSSGVFGGDVLALKLNVDLSDAGVTLGSSGIPFGDLVIANYALIPVLNGLSVRQVLAAANTDLGGGNSELTIGELTDLVPTLDIAFEGTPTVFAQDFLVSPNSTGGGTSVPEPSTIALFGLGAAGLALSRRRLAAHAG